MKQPASADASFKEINCPSVNLEGLNLKKLLDSNVAYSFGLVIFVLGTVIVFPGGYVALGLIYGGVVGLALFAAACLTLASTMFYIEEATRRRGFALAGSIGLGFAALIVDSAAELPWGDFSPFNSSLHFAAWTGACLVAAVVFVWNTYERRFIPARDQR